MVVLNINYHSLIPFFLKNKVTLLYQNNIIIESRIKYMRAKITVVIVFLLLFLLSSSLNCIGINANKEVFSDLSSYQIMPVGDPYFILLSDYTDGAGDDNLWAVQLRFDIDLGVVESEFDNKTLPLVTDEWVEIRIEIDLNNDFMKMYYNDELLHQKEWSAGPENTGNGIVNLSAVNLYSDTSTSVYFDDFVLEEVGEGIIWSDSFDTYEDGSEIHGQGGWKGWDNDPEYTAYVSSFFNRSFPNALEISYGADIVRVYFGNYSGEFIYSAWMYFPVNVAPNPPEINGPSGGAEGENYNFSFAATDQNSDDIWYYIEWGDGTFEEWIGPYSSGEEVIVGHSWSEVGEYTIRAKARDGLLFESKWSEPFSVIISNPPDAPDISVPQKIRKGREYEIIFSSTDPDDDDVKYFIDWGDGNTFESEYFVSGADAKIKHTWVEKGNFIIEAYAVDIYNAESEVSTNEVIVPKSREPYSHFDLLSKFFSFFSNIFDVIF
jgi:hypothetical protein